MTKQRKSPQLKKELSLKKDHFTFAEYPHAFRRNWKRKKARANREYRRKSEQLLAPAKPRISAGDAEAVFGDLTNGHLKNSISRKRLRKSGTVSVGQMVDIKLRKREEMVGRRVNDHRKYDLIVTNAVHTLTSFEREELTSFLRRAKKYLQGGDPIEWMRIGRSDDNIDRALWFLERLERGDGNFWDALRRDQELCEAFQQWRKEANRILMKEARPSLRKAEEKRTIEKKLKAMRRASDS